MERYNREEAACAFHSQCRIIALLQQTSHDNFDVRSINQVWKDDEELVKQNALLLGQPSVQALFNGYYFDFTINTGPANGAPNKQTTGKEQPSGHSQITADTTNKAT